MSKLGRRNGKLLRRDGKLCRGCCGEASGACASGKAAGSFFQTRPGRTAITTDGFTPDESTLIPWRYYWGRTYEARMTFNYSFSLTANSNHNYTASGNTFTGSATQTRTTSIETARAAYIAVGGDPLYPRSLYGGAGLGSCVVCAVDDGELSASFSSETAYTDFVDNNGDVTTFSDSDTSTVPMGGPNQVGAAWPGQGGSVVQLSGPAFGDSLFGSSSPSYSSQTFGGAIIPDSNLDARLLQNLTHPAYQVGASGSRIDRAWPGVPLRFEKVQDAVGGPLTGYQSFGYRNPNTGGILNHPDLAIQWELGIPVDLTIFPFNRSESFSVTGIESAEMTVDRSLGTTGETWAVDVGMNASADANLVIRDGVGGTTYTNTFEGSLSCTLEITYGEDALGSGPF